MKKRGIRRDAIRKLAMGLIEARKQAEEYGASIPNTYKIKGRTDYYIYHTPGKEEAWVTAIFYDGLKEHKKIDFKNFQFMYNCYHGHLN